MPGVIGAIDFLVGTGAILGSPERDLVEDRA